MNGVKVIHSLLKMNNKSEMVDLEIKNERKKETSATSVAMPSLIGHDMQDPAFLKRN